MNVLTKSLNKNNNFPPDASRIISYQYYSIISEILDEIFLSENFDVKHVFDRKINKIISIDFRDKSEIRNTVSGVIKNKYLLEYILKKYSVKPLGKFKRKEKIIIFTGIYEIMFSSKPEYAAVCELVTFSKKKCGENFGNFVNALLKKIAADKEKIKTSISSYPPAIRFSQPQWFLDLLYGQKYLADFVEDILKFYHTPPNYYLRVNNIKSSIDTVISSLNDSGILSEYNNICHPGLNNCIKICGLKTSLNELPAIKNSLAYIQDISSQICSVICAEELNSSGEKNVFFDICSAPGGKLMTIYNSTTNKSETDFIAMDVQTRRLQILKDNLKHYIGKIDNLKVVCGNLKKIPFMFRSNEKKTVILFDAPCSGSGIINRYPGKLFSMNKNNIMELSELQFEGLKNIIESVKPGTTVIYSVCSVLFEETYLIIQKIKKKYSNIVSGNIDNSIFKSVLKFYSTDEGNLIYPSSISDGFFIAKLIRL